MAKMHSLKNYKSRKPLGAIQCFFLENISHFVIQPTPYFSDMIIHQLHYMEVVKNKFRIGEVFSHRTDISRT